jgi:hypothetical protein
LVQSLTFCIYSSSSWFWRLWWHSREQHALNLQLFGFAGIWNRLGEQVVVTTVSWQWWKDQR